MQWCRGRPKSKHDGQSHIAYGLYSAERVTPSLEQSFTVSGQNLTSNISLSAPATYEISITSGSGFGPSLTLAQSGGTVSSTAIYVRLKAGYPSGSYDGENITISTAGTSDQTITCSGVVKVPSVIEWNGNEYSFVEMPWTYDGKNVIRVYTYGEITSFSANNITSLEINGQSYAADQTHTDPAASIDQKFFITIIPLKIRRGVLRSDGDTKRSYIS
ncbi:MAG: hypothetical protein U5N26_09515 [Candidatus Marinimicrobia bacterium]|nr:hypothetical protein [Candidatus Neomarinimicrobiota bacterium]